MDLTFHLKLRWSGRGRIRIDYCFVEFELLMLLRARYLKSLVRVPGKDVHIYGILHERGHGKGSAEEAARAVVMLNPRQVMLEIDEARFASTLEHLKRGMNMSEPSRSDIVSNVHGGLLTRELKLAVEAAKSIGAAVYLIDRPHRITQNRVARSILHPVSFANLFKYGAMSLEARKTLKSPEEVKQLTDFLEENCPGVHRVLITERNEFMASQINAESSEKTLVICGASHVPGLTELLSSPELLKNIDLTEITRKGVTLWPLVILLYLVIPVSIAGWVWFSGVRVVLKHLRKALGIPDLQDTQKKQANLM